MDPFGKEDIKTENILQYLSKSNKALHNDINAKKATISSNLPRNSDTVLDDQNQEGPKRRLFSKEELPLWLESQAYAILYNFIESACFAIRGKPLSYLEKQKEDTPPGILACLSVLQELLELVTKYPPHGDTSRYGNIVFREWFQEVCNKTDEWMIRILRTRTRSSSPNSFPQQPSGDEVQGTESKNSEKNDTTSTIPIKIPDKDNLGYEKWEVEELGAYFKESFGNNTRIDYGTGHELSFAAWMYCLIALGVVNPNTQYLHLLLQVFPTYLSLVRFVQKTYKLEPAGSHGVWGLDDYQFLPFLWGANQLIGHDEIKPSAIQDKRVLEEYSVDFMYLSCIKFIKEVKKGAFFEHSPMLHDISQLPNWQKASNGLMKMYRVEVLDKFVVIQHFLFGKLLPFEKNQSK